ncbi:hypothetical protein FRB94_012800 [Tulasnella sp. JGI-2019a]|nr:hypothetical protein FRB94_012800 [Tulasnella sp. JGI-2019a]KAG9018514.1 hypothetical protein FRB93_000217 [Tulasnella sp. JGI-2019a]KAG9037503.1 hypothetical protein FRB95_005442 [Tulasnella sp. JGI-2019a]
MSSIASLHIPSLFDEHEAQLKEDIQKRTVVPLNNRRRHHRRPAILRKLGHLRLSLPSVTPPPPPPPEHLFADMDGAEIDLERNPYHHWISRDGAGRRQKATAVLTPQRVILAISVVMLVVLALVLSMIPQSAIVSLIQRVRTR